MGGGTREAGGGRWRHFGHGPGDDASDNALDRAIFDELKPWRTSEANDGVDLTAARNNLASFGHSCA